MVAIMTPWDFYDAYPYMPSEAVFGEPLVSVDNMAAFCHPFAKQDQDYLLDCGATLYDEIPSSFVLPEVDYGFI